MVADARPMPELPSRWHCARTTQRNWKCSSGLSQTSSPLYGQYLSDDQLHTLIAPSSETLANVTQWLMQHGIMDWSISNNGGFIKVSTPVDTAERLLLGARFHYYYHHQIDHVQQNKAAKPIIIRTLKPYSLPGHLKDHIDFVGGIHYFPKIKTNGHLARSSSSRGRRSFGFVDIDPPVLKRVLNITNDGGKSLNNSQSVSVFLEQYYRPSDLALFQETYNLTVEPVAKQIGPNHPEKVGFEATLDIEYLMGVAPHVPTWFISIPGLHEDQEPFLDWMFLMNNLTDAPLVNSISFDDYESSVSPSYAKRVDQEFQRFGVTGRTLIFASGDYGVGCDSEGTRFEPVWPANSAYVTSVGGVMLMGENPLNITSDGISSGGFSNYFPQPAYQRQAVLEYFSNANNLPSKEFYNVSGRAVPDVSIFSEFFVITYNNHSSSIGGTSCGAPVFSAMMSLINDERLLRGQPPVGFLNTQLYQIAQMFPTAFLDITLWQRQRQWNSACQASLPPKVGILSRA